MTSLKCTVARNWRESEAHDCVFLLAILATSAMHHSHAA